MPNLYISSPAYTAVTAWAATTAYSSTSNGGRGDYRRQLATPAVGSERVFRCTTAGTSGASEPAWNTGKNATTADGTAVWTECTGQEADQVAGNWKAPHARSSNALAAGWSAAGDRYFVSDDHAATQATALALTFPGTPSQPNEMYCVTRTGATLPPTSADLRNTAQENTSGANIGVTVMGAVYIYGVNRNTGTSNGGQNYGGATITDVFEENCNHAPATSGVITIGATNNSIPVRVRWKNVKATFANVGAGLSMVSVADFQWRDTPSAINGTMPTKLFTASVSGGGVALLDGVDLSGMGAGKTIVGAYAKAGLVTLKDCKLNAAVTIQEAITSTAQRTFVVRSDATGTNYRSDFYGYAGTQTTSATVVRTGSLATDTSAIIAYRLAASANAKRFMSLQPGFNAEWNPTTGANVTVTVYGISANDSAALPKNDEIWHDVSYSGSAASPLGSWKYGGPADGLAAGVAWTADTSAWDSQAPARVNSATYAVGDPIKVASNPGRVFFCTAGGAANATEPAGFASAVDGGTVTDGAATFRAGMRFRMAITLTSPQPAIPGEIYTYLHVGLANGVYYVDPSPILS